MTALAKLSDEIRQYLIITTNYWAFTLTDGALRMLVVLHFYSLGYSPLQIAMLFLFYEIFGVITNLVGGWLGAHIGLNKTMNIGLLLQVVALSMLLVPSEWLTVIWVMAAQALSGVAKDLNKMSAKSAIKLLVPKEENGQLYKWVAALTGSKNALKGVGFFLGGGLLTLSGFKGAVLVMALGLMMVWIFSLFSLKQELGRAKNKPKFSHVFSKSQSVNVLSAARMFLFGSRDVWFVVALPVYLSTSFGWDHWYVGGFLALWVIGYGAVQGFTPRLTTRSKNRLPDGKDALFWALALSLIPVLIAVALAYSWHKELVLIVGLMIFGVLFAINSALHSYLIVSYAGEDGVSLDVGFYYMANAMGRLIGTVLSGWLYQSYGLGFCLWMSALFIVITAVISLYLPKHKRASASI
ncbi:MAG TPA: organoarsenical effux MFS transporter ArsJ [Methylophaga aminisulfidivorans]|uniref:Arabinose efflux permease n=1 Tax=Methylophaga aminisulfidivorans MP TaxID=1026882 RepID=F5T2B6_9GAMM|nr:MULTISPECIES: organoarsenical effux MFS transporter ArsJ [Methylophaga]EGL53173.1 arabinose efflux permease [Methylophaga aminisulfidivorans MP]HIC46167.1 organoarsenical effux MFS transporter ArsJ [Methylophaga sp.]HIM40087.1 organoarsenical effux MFS transporter ArsJ [Methylophaga aminisulfidivorans]